MCVRKSGLEELNGVKDGSCNKGTLNSVCVFFVSGHSSRWIIQGKFNNVFYDYNENEAGKPFLFQENHFAIRKRSFN